MHPVSSPKPGKILTVKPDTIDLLRLEIQMSSRISAKVAFFGTQMVVPV